jgi:hypothetical protein
MKHKENLSTIDKEIWDNAFTPIIWEFVKHYNEADGTFLKKKIKESLKQTIYRWTDLPPAYVSAEIIRLFEENNIDADPFDLIYTNRETLGRGIDGKTIMLWEHTTPNNETYQSIVKCDSIEELRIVMSNHSGVCWLTREEDTLLNKSGFRSERANGWEDAYKKCNITVVKRK